jgi:mannan endo-1,4-beta-mannosidase
MLKLNLKQRNVALLIVSASLTMLFSCKKETGNVVQPSSETVQDNAPVSSLTSTTAGSLGNGVNIQPSYYNGGNPDFGWSLMKTKTKIKTVRLEIEPDKVTQAKNWIAKAKSNGYAIIATYHKSSVLGSDNTADLNAAANWWKTNYNTLGGGFVVNLMNEWGSHNISPANFASAYNSAISIVRQVYSGTIIIDIPGWGQETSTAACAVKGCATGQTKITDTKIVLSAHIYPGAWNQVKGRYNNTSDIDDLASSGRGCMIGEFGNSGGSGADWSGIVDYARNKGWTVLGWCWNGDGGSMNMVTPSWATNGGATSFSTSSYFNVVYNKL